MVWQGDGVMDGWWDEVDGQIEKVLFRSGGMSPSDLAGEVGLSEAATVSLLARLAAEGRVRIARVEPGEPSSS